MVEMAASAIAMKQAQLYEQLSMSAVKMQMEAQQKMAQMLLDNAKQIEALSQQAAARGGIDIFV
ncbi:MAG: hypothetical protein HZB31_14930 [Nitrospirae bacterium]|nr:hypothetical protein [Nitrospirota bacterium]